MNRDSLRIAHLSDPHFSYVTYSPSQFLSKRWIGNMNLFFHRKKAYQTEHLWHLPELMESLKVEHVFITGDFSSTSLDEEFAEGRCLVSSFRDKGLPLYFVPGNHDCYTKKAQSSRRFYTFFHSESLQSRRVERLSLKKGWWYIGLDCAVATPPFCAYGVFTPEMAEALVWELSRVPKDERVIISNHFPLFSHGRPLHDLKGAARLQQILKQFPQVKLYLHGHDHSLYIIDRQSEGLPLVLNSGSCAHKPDGTFYLIDLFDTECLIERLLFRKENEKFSWVIDWQRSYKWNRG